jgi:hypothetical protein
MIDQRKNETEIRLIRGNEKEGEMKEVVRI